MGLIILFVMGGITGWLATIAVGTTDRDGVVHNVMAGIFGALLVGTLINNGSILEGISAVSLLLAFLGSIAILIPLHLIRGRVTR